MAPELRSSIWSPACDTTVDEQDCPQNPLFLAATNDKVGSVRLLLKYRNGPSQWPVPEMLYQTAAKGHVHVLQLLLDNGAKDVRRARQDYHPCFRDPARPIRARTALHEAVAPGFPSGIVDLLSNDENIRTTDLKGKIPLHEAVLGQHIATAEEWSQSAEGKV